MMLSTEAAIRLSEAILSQASKDYIKQYKKTRTFSKSIEEYIRQHPIVGENADYIIPNLRAAARSKAKLKRKTHRVRVNGKAV